MQYRVLGEVDVVVAGETRAIGSPNQRLVLAALLAHPGITVSTDALIEALWDDDPPTSALSTLRTYVSRLRRTVGENLVGDVIGYRLMVEPFDIDARRFEQRLEEAGDAEPARAVGLLDAALAMWRGPAFGDHADIPLIVGAARRLEELRASALEARVVALLAAGEATKASADATALLADHPLREGLWLTLIDALVAARRSADATRAAARARGALAEAGLEPGAELRAAESRALGIGTASLDTAGLAPRTISGRAATPITGSGRPSSFIGRDQQLDEVVDLLAGAHIVTLVGPGGVGKTRLAIELAARVAPRHRLGARLIELGALSDADDVAGAIASGLGLTVDASSIDTALASAGDLDMVVVVDNAEHVAAAAAHAIEELASGSGPMRMIITSRERLGVDGEHVRAVRPLSSDDSSSPAQALLRERAMAAGAALDGRHGETITRLVRRLDGLPLAIEMAAAQLTSCSLTELLATLDEHLDELRAMFPRVPPRHQSLGALIDWSIDRLDPNEATQLHQLMVFAGSFTAADVVGVLGPDTVDTTRLLADRSLVAATVTTDRTSFRVLHVVRERVLHLRGPVPDEKRAAHARWYLATARSAVAELTSPRERSGREALNEILDELRAAHRWSSDHERSLALALSATIHPFAQSSLNDEVLSWADRLVIDTPQRGDDPDDAAITMASAATRLVHRGDHLGGADLARRALTIAEHAAARVPALEAHADATLAEGLLDDSDASYQALIDQARLAGSTWYEASGATGVLLVAAYSGRPPSRDIDPTAFDQDTPPSARAWIAYGQGELAAADDPGRAEAFYRSALTLARSGSNRFAEGVSLTSLASVQATTDTSAALVTYRSAIEYWFDVADHTHQITTLRNLAVLLCALDLPVETAQLLGGLAVTDVATYGIELANLDTIDTWVAGALPPDELADARAEGARLDLSDLARWALALVRRHTTQLETAAEDRDARGD